ncbi:hypothetical protein ACE41R_04315 [Alteromonas macleodii]|jgi:hypothetical protein|uniref:hypothetical protein n=2 Tax=Alteromonas macleodii TaxID=28108 RepID=UPI00313FE4B6
MKIGVVFLSILFIFSCKDLKKEIIETSSQLQNCMNNKKFEDECTKERRLLDIATLKASSSGIRENEVQASVRLGAVKIGHLESDSPYQKIKASLTDVMGYDFEMTPKHTSGLNYTCSSPNSMIGNPFNVWSDLDASQSLKNLGIDLNSNTLSSEIKDVLWRYKTLLSFTDHPNRDFKDKEKASKLVSKLAHETSKHQQRALSDQLDEVISREIGNFQYDFEREDIRYLNLPTDMLRIEGWKLDNSTNTLSVFTLLTRPYCFNENHDYIKKEYPIITFKQMSDFLEYCNEKYNCEEQSFLIRSKLVDAYNNAPD